MQRILAAGLAASALLGASCGTGDDASGAAGLEITVAFYPLAFVAQGVGGDAVTVTDLTPPGVEPHDIELNPGQVATLIESDLVVYLGNGFQPAVEDALTDVGDDRTLDILEGLTLLEGDADDHGNDPHVWLDPRNMAAIAERVEAALSQLDAGNAENYSANAARLISELDELHREFEGGLAECERREIVVSHEAFGYLTAAYGLEQVGVSGLDPDIEPSPARLVEVQRFAEEHGVTTIFFEGLASPATAETLAGELGIATATLSPLETPPEEGDYLSAMRANLEALEVALGCS